jgi:hypothetical protein
MTYAFTGSELQFSQSVRLRRQAAEEAAKPQAQTEIEKLSDIYLAAYKQREAEAAARERADIAAGKLRIL